MSLPIVIKKYSKIPPIYQVMLEPDSELYHQFNMYWYNLQDFYGDDRLIQNKSYCINIPEYHNIDNVLLQISDMKVDPYDVNKYSLLDNKLLYNFSTQDYTYYIVIATFKGTVPYYPEILEQHPKYDNKKNSNNILDKITSVSFLDKLTSMYIWDINMN